MQSRIASYLGQRLCSSAWLCIFWFLVPSSGWAINGVLQGQTASSSTWITGTLTGWEELESIPCRVLLQGGPATNYDIVIEFQHSQGPIPGIQHLFSFSTSDNVKIVSGPTLSAPPGNDVWSYIFSVDVKDNGTGYVKFKASLAAGAHLNGSSLTLSGSGSLGVLQIQTPPADSGTPDLVVRKTGPAQASIGEIITYTLTCSNKAKALHDGEGVQVSDILPEQVTFVSASDDAVLVGNTLTWDLDDLDKGERKVVKYSVRVNSNAQFGQDFTNYAQIYSAENDTNYLDNSSSVTTTVLFNYAPVANDNSYNVDEDRIRHTSAPGVLANDTDADGNALQAILVHGPSDGEVTLNADGSFTYTPDPDFYGTDSFTYKANDGLADSDIATVQIIVNPINDRPLASDDVYSVDEDTLLTVLAPGVLLNDDDIDEDALSALLLSGPAHGTLTLNPDGSFLYMPDPNYYGLDTFTYEAHDGIESSGETTVRIIVNPVNGPPTVGNDAFTVNQGQSLAISAPGVLANDSDLDGDSLTAILIGGPSHGTLILQSDGSFIYTPAADYTGTDAFSYKANDGRLDSATATVVITTISVNERPTANNDVYSVNEDATLTIVATGILANDTDPDGDPLTAHLLAGPSHGTLNLSANGAFVYAPASNYKGADSFTYKANDGRADSGPATVQITVRSVNDAPVARADSYQTTEDQPLVISAPGVLGNDTDEDGDVLEALVVRDPAHGMLDLNFDGSFTYTPAANYHGTDQFTYQANDGNLESAITTVNITISAVNDPPVARTDSYSLNENTTLSVAAPGVLGNDTDVDGESLLAVLVSPPLQGKLTLMANGSFLYEPNTNYNGADSFSYKANDGTTDSSVAIVNISVAPVNDIPEADDDVYSGFEDTPLSVPAPGVLANDVDGEGSPLAAFLVTLPAHGTLDLNPDGSFTYTPELNYNGSDSFTYRASDGSDASGPATVLINIEPVNDSPSFLKGPNQLVQQNAGTQTVPGWVTNLSTGPSDEAGQTCSFIARTDNDSLFSVPPTINPQCTLSYTPASGVSGVATVVVVVQDNAGTAHGGVDTSVAQTFTITVNTPPVVNIVTPTNGAFYLAPANIAVVAEASDPDGVVTNAMIFQGTNLLANLDATPYYTIWTNVPVGQYQFSAWVADDAGAATQSSPVNVTVLDRPPLMIVKEITLNRQTGLYEQTVRITNPTIYAYDAVRVLVRNLRSVARVYNASGKINNIPYVQSNLPIPPGGSVDLKIEYYDPDRQQPNPIFEQELVSPNPPPNPLGTFQRVSRVLPLSDGTVLIEFNSLSYRTYLVQYSANMKDWKTVSPSVAGTGTRVQWIDNGPPKTDAAPIGAGRRFYRVLMLP